MNSFTKLGERYGQFEEFTSRIRNLLKDYPDGLSIPKELIQNSDDAKVRVIIVHFLFQRSRNLWMDLETKKAGIRSFCIKIFNRKFCRADLQKFSEKILFLRKQQMPTENICYIIPLVGSLQQSMIGNEHKISNP